MQGGSVLPVPAKNHPVTTMVSGFQIPLVTAILVYIDVMKMQPDHFFLCSHLGNKMEKALAPHSSTLAWKIPWMEEPGRLQSMGSLRVRHD